MSSTVETQNTINWISVTDEEPPITCRPARSKPYVLAVDAKNRMSVGYALEHSTAGYIWVFAKPIGEPTHWMPLPAPPHKASEAGSVGRGNEEHAEPLLIPNLVS